MQDVTVGTQTIKVQDGILTSGSANFTSTPVSGHATWRLDVAIKAILKILGNLPYVGAAFTAAEPFSDIIVWSHESDDTISFETSWSTQQDGTYQAQYSVKKLSDAQIPFNALVKLGIKFNNILEQDAPLCSTREIIALFNAYNPSFTIKQHKAELGEDPLILDITGTTIATGAYTTYSDIKKITS